jgi:hypothetical protein
MATPDGAIKYMFCNHAVHLAASMISEAVGFGSFIGVYTI